MPLALVKDEQRWLAKAGERGMGTSNVLLESCCPLFLNSKGGLFVLFHLFFIAHLLQKLTTRVEWLEQNIKVCL